MSLETMQDLLVEQLRDLHDAESGLIPLAPRMERMTWNEALRGVVRHRAELVEEHLARLTAIFEYFGASTGDGTSPAATGLVEEMADVLRHEGPDEVFDAALLIELRRLAHFSIAGYTALIALAEALGEVTIIRLLQMTLDEELGCERKLSAIARTEVNPDGALAGVPAEARALGLGSHWQES